MRHRLTHYTLLLLSIFIVISLMSCVGKPRPAIQWYRTFGSGDEVRGNSVQQTTDGGYIVCGRIYSYKTSAEGGAWLIKTDAEGNKIWDKIFNLSGSFAFGESVQQTIDGGYILCGTVVPREIGTYCIWLIKTDAEGNKLWDKTFAPSSKRGAWGNSVQQTKDGGYIVGGRSGDHLRLIKTDADGNKVWDKTFVGQELDIANSVRQTTDGGYIVCGSTWPTEAGGFISRQNVWLIKTDAEGDKLWDRMFGGALFASGYSVQQTTDGGYIICGTGDTEKTIKRLGPLLIKTDAEGNKLWDKVLYRDGNKFLDKMFSTNGGYSYSAQQTTEGSYIVCGTTQHGDVWIIKTDAEGNKLWEKTFDKEIKGSAIGYSIQQTADGGYIVSGSTYSEGSNHVLLLKIAPEQ